MGSASFSRIGLGGLQPKKSSGCRSHQALRQSEVSVGRRMLFSLTLVAPPSTNLFCGGLVLRPVQLPNDSGLEFLCIIRPAMSPFSENRLESAASSSHLAGANNPVVCEGASSVRATA